MSTERHKEPNEKVDDFDPTEDREASEETKGASNQTESRLNRHLTGIFFSVKILTILTYGYGTPCIVSILRHLLHFLQDTPSEQKENLWTRVLGINRKDFDKILGMKIHDSKLLLENLAKIES